MIKDNYPQGGRDGVTAGGMDPVSKEKGEIIFWGEEKHFGHSNEMTVFSKLLVYRQRYIDSIVEIEDGRQEELNRQKKEWEMEIAAFRSERDQTEQKRLQDMNAQIEIFSNKKKEQKESFNREKRDFDDQIDEIRKKLDVLGKLDRYQGNDAPLLLKAKKCFLDAISEMEKEKERRDTGYDGSRVELMSSYEQNMSRIEAEAQSELDGIDSRKRAYTEQYDAACRQIDQKYAARVEELNREYDRLFAENFDERQINRYLEAAKSNMMQAEHYVCPQKMADYLHLGNLFVHMERTAETARGFDRLIGAHAKGLGVEAAGGTTLALPYLQSFREGVSAVIRHNGSDQVRDLLKDMVLKTLMSYPAGKVVATMIDPKGLGGSFAGLGRLGGDKNAWMRDTKIWSEEKEIEAAMSRFRETAENWIQIYGQDKDALMQKEQLKILAIMDFPQHFTERALDSLWAVIRNCRTTGTIIFIISERGEFERLMLEAPDNREDFRKCVMLDQIEDRNDFIVNQYSRYHISLQGFGSVRKYANTIINTLTKEAESYQPPVIPFSALYKKDMLDSNYWFTENPRSFSVPIGYHSFNAPMSLTFGAVNDTRQNVLIEGMPRSGKTNLLHNIILGGLLGYSPQYLQFYLIDFKDGVEFREYADYLLPGIRVIAVDAQREFALSILEDLAEEMTRRNNEFGRLSANDIESYNQRVDSADIMPRLVLIFDEVTALFGREDSVSKACLEHLLRIQTKGGNVGIHTILATQDYDQCKGIDLERDFSLAKLRIVTFGREDATCSILKSTDGMAIGRIGSALFNDNGGEAANNRYLRVATSKLEVLPDGEPCRQDYLASLDAYFQKVSDLYQDYDTRVWTQNLEKNPNLYFNRIVRMSGTGMPLSELTLTRGRELGMLMGNGIRNNFHVISLQHRSREHLLMLAPGEGNNGKMAESVLICMLLSLACEAALKGLNDTRIYILDGSVKRGAAHRDRKKLVISDLSGLFEGIDYFRGRDEGFEELLLDLASEMERRLEEGWNAPVYLLLNRIDDMEVHFRDTGAEDGCRACLHRLLAHGAEAGIHVIVTGEYYDVVVSRILEDRINEYFNKRIAIHLSDSEQQYNLVYKREVSEQPDDRIAVIYDRISEEAEVDAFSVYDIPDYAWVEEIASVIAPQEEEEGW